MIFGCGMCSVAQTRQFLAFEVTLVGFSRYSFSGLNLMRHLDNCDTSRLIERKTALWREILRGFTGSDSLLAPCAAGVQLSALTSRNMACLETRVELHTTAE